MAGRDTTVEHKRRTSADAPPGDIPVLLGDPNQKPLPPDRMPMRTSMEFGCLSETPGISGSCAALEKPHSAQSHDEVPTLLDGLPTLPQ